LQDDENNYKDGFIHTINDGIGYNVWHNFTRLLQAGDFEFNLDFQFRVHNAKIVEMEEKLRMIDAKLRSLQDDRGKLKHEKDYLLMWEDMDEKETLEQKTKVYTIEELKNLLRVEEETQKNWIQRWERNELELIVSVNNGVNMRLPGHQELDQYRCTVKFIDERAKPVRQRTAWLKITGTTVSWRRNLRLMFKNVDLSSKITFKVSHRRKRTFQKKTVVGKAEKTIHDLLMICGREEETEIDLEIMNQYPLSNPPKIIVQATTNMWKLKQETEASFSNPDFLRDLHKTIDHIRKTIKQKEARCNLEIESPMTPSGTGALSFLVEDYEEPTSKHKDASYMSDGSETSCSQQSKLQERLEQEFKMNSELTDKVKDLEAMVQEKETVINVLADSKKLVVEDLKKIKNERENEYTTLMQKIARLEKENRDLVKKLERKSKKERMNQQPKPLRRRTLRDLSIRDMKSQPTTSRALSNTTGQDMLKLFPSRVSGFYTTSVRPKSYSNLSAKPLYPSVRSTPSLNIKTDKTPSQSLAQLDEDSALCLPEIPNNIFIPKQVKFTENC